MIVKFFCLLIIYLMHYSSADDDIDPNGYLMFCPCMGKIYLLKQKLPQV